jgi:hypothetical protein
MLGDTSQEDLAAFQVDEEQHIEPAQPDRVDVEQVTRQRARSLCAKKLRPGRS